MGLKVLVLEAHVDDATCGCGATILKHLKRGDKVQWHTFVGKGYRVPEGWAKDSLAIEYENAMGVLGVGDHFLYNYKVDTADKTTELRNLIHMIWHNFKPDIAYVPWAKSRHQDHRAIGDFAHQVSWRSNADVLAYPVVNDIEGFSPTVFAPIDNKTMDIKLKALEQFESQFVLRPWFRLDLIESFMHTYAQFVDTLLQYAEPFEQVRRTIL